ncbi:hypothetical protein ACHHYP_15975 [Achlya hypogyna]|uniref:DDE-1 domain-containing protein n=1 Tax=Achlya hypogyna TaxID=1202772 RepID=A0A1V9Y9Y1_ACHHY|nr:hypothetical protein ACHHYP_15975 [Achlya hypogyna]
MFLSGTYANPNAFATLVKVPSATFYGWVQRSSAILAYDGPESAATLGRQGGVEANPFSRGLVTFMKGMRRTDEMVTTYNMIEYVAWYYREWYTTYINSKLSPERGYLTLFRYLQRFAHRHGFRRRVPTASKIAREKLMIIRDDFACSLGADNVYNVDETAVYYDMPPRCTWAFKGETSHALASQKNSDRITAVLTICANGEKLPVLFIVHGKPGATIEREELPQRIHPNMSRHKRAVIIDRVARVWRALKPETIAGSFEKALPKLT